MLIKKAHSSIRMIRKLDAPNNKDVDTLVRQINSLAIRLGIKIINELTDQCDSETLYIALGGDGTMIHAAKQASKTDSEVVGFNLGKVGFLADYAPSDVIKIIEAAVTGELKVQERNMIDVTLPDGSVCCALNDVVVSNMYSDTVIHYDLEVNGHHAGKHISNSLIFSTSTGSTAYSLNTGGAIIDPAVDVIEMIPVAASAMTTSLRPIIISGRSRVNMYITLKPGASLSVKNDGMQIHDSCDLHNETDKVANFTVTITKCNRPVKMLITDDWNFFDILATKLKWNH